MEIPVEEYFVPIGKAKVVREGKDITLVSYCRMVEFCLEAVMLLKEQGINPRSLICARSVPSISQQLRPRFEKRTSVF